MASRSLQGIVPALVTPFRADERIDYGAWQAIVDAMIAAGVDGLLAEGSQGEFFALDMEERQVALRFCAQAIAGRVTLYGNVGCVTTRDSVALARAAESMGVDVAVVVTPYYIRPSPDELAEHYIEVCRAVHLPVLGYNFPLHGGVELTPEVVARIATKCENFAGLKDSSGALDRALAFVRAVPERPFAVFVGFDNLILPALEQGCAGSISASANVAPRLFVDLYRAFREGRRNDAARLQTLASELGGAVMLHTFPSVVKEAMHLAGLPAGPCRKPVGPVPPEAREQLARVVAKLAQENYLPNAPKTTAA
ncbi:MAG: dihydrodipicolinate synthase family protein [Acidobacteriia bacterium]|nr:dihydrodipicolinate synthase family protein [Terriglobia bacterium]